MAPAGGSGSSGPAASAAATDRRWVAERVREAGCVCGRRNGGKTQLRIRESRARAGSRLCEN